MEDSVNLLNEATDRLRSASASNVALPVAPQPPPNFGNIDVQAPQLANIVDYITSCVCFCVMNDPIYEPCCRTIHACRTCIET